MKSKIAVLMIGLLMLPLLMMAQPATQVKSGNKSKTWERIGACRVNFSKEIDVVSISKSEKYRFIKIKVTDAPVEISKFTLVYDNGRREEVPIRARIPEGQSSRVIAINRGNRSLKRVEFVYKSAAGLLRGRPYVTLYGKM